MNLWIWLARIFIVEFCGIMLSIAFDNFLFLSVAIFIDIIPLYFFYKHYINKAPVPQHDQINQPLNKPNCMGKYQLSNKGLKEKMV